MSFLSCNEVLKHSTAQEKKDEAYFMALLKTVQSTPGLYFSYETDVIFNFQRRSKLMKGWMAKPIWKQDYEFVHVSMLILALFGPKIYWTNLLSISLMGSLFLYCKEIS